MDDLWRPAVYIRHRFMEKRAGVVRDEATGLLWEKGGTPYLVTWHEARRYVDRLNQERFAGFSDWRLPTVPELMSIFRRVDQPGDFCLPSLFDPDKQRLWSIDRKSFVAAWYADAEMGFVWWQDFTCYFHARAVRTAQGPD
jgi:serine/threonine-protein kinase